MIHAGLKQLSQALAAKQVSSVELTRLFLERIERLNPALNAFVTVDPEKSLNSARAADARIAGGTAGPLTGIPIAQKDIFCAEGWRTTCGSKMLANFVSPYDATVIRKMETEAGLLDLRFEFRLNLVSLDHCDERLGDVGIHLAFSIYSGLWRALRSTTIWERKHGPWPMLRVWLSDPEITGHCSSH